MRRIHAFDFDGTITENDSLAAFLRFVCGRRRFWQTMLVQSPVMAAALAGLYDRGKAKERLFGYVFRGMTGQHFSALCQQFAEANVVRLHPDATAAIASAQQKGEQVVVVTASVDEWVKAIVPQLKVIGTRIEVVEGRLTGRFLTPNCSGAEKVRRLLKDYPNRASYHLTAYGDSRGDRELLAFADEGYYKIFGK